MEKKNYNKGGRPPKKASERRKYIVRSLMCTSDYFAIKARAKACRKSLSTFMKEAALNAVIKEPFTTEQMYFFRQLSGMANNLNQIAYQANAQGYVSAASACNALASEIDKVIKTYKHDM
ncbi:MAG: MobC family plasmid mobilization relaxosome protein [Prevotella melaninogenica]|jgi:bacterial mobilization protein MobC